MVVRFLCDAMLGDVARWLRLMGFDAEYASNDLPDADVESRARAEARVLLTRDARLHASARRRGGVGVLLAARDLDEDLVAALRSTGAVPDARLRYSRCAHCNAVLDRVDRDSVVVPPKVRETHDAYWKCGRCHQVYWEGTHVREIEKRLSHIERRLGEAR